MDYPGGPNTITRILKNEGNSEEDMITEEQVETFGNLQRDVTLSPSKTGKGS